MFMVKRFVLFGLMVLFFFAVKPALAQYPLGPPTNLRVSCTNPGTSATAYWDAGTNATYYSLRIDQDANSWNGTCASPDTCADINSLSYGPFSVDGNGRVKIWVHSRNAGGAFSSAVEKYFYCAPNCSNLSGSTSLVTGQTSTYSADFSSDTGNLEWGFYSSNGWNTNPFATQVSSDLNPISVNKSTSWTAPATAGTYTLYCDAWNDARAECKGSYASRSGAIWPCRGPNSSLTINVVAPTSTPVPPTNTPVPPTPTPRPPTSTPIPPTPTPTLTIPTLSCSSYAYGTTWSWNSVSRATSYWLQVWDDVWKSNSWYSSSPQSFSGTPGVTYSGQVKSGDGSGQSGWSSTVSCTVPMPTNTPIPPTPTPTPPNCNATPVYGSCTEKYANSCGSSGGTRTRTYTTYSGGGSCTQVTDNVDCNVNCANGYTCNSGTCLINCSVTSQTPATGCFLVPTLAAGVGNGANQVSYTIGSCSSSDLSAGSSYSCSTLTTGNYNWTASAKSSTGACYTQSATVGPITIDKTAPNVPPSSTLAITKDTSDVNCPDGKYTATYSWSASTDISCSGLNSAPYWSQLSTNSSFSSVIPGSTNTWGSTRSNQATGVAPGNTIYAHVRSRDAFDNQSTWSTPYDSYTIPAPSPYPTIHVSGNFQEDTGTSCGAFTADPSLLTVGLASPATGVTSVCTKNTTDYSCDITIDNVNNPCILPDQNLTLSVDYHPTTTGYGVVGWRSPNNCNGSANNSITVDAKNPGNQSKDLFFKLGDSSVYSSWFKLSTSSLNVRSNIDNIIPQNVQAFDSDDTTAKLLLVNNSGVLINSGRINIGVNNDYAYPDWTLPTYATSFNASLNQSTYNEYLKTRKDTYVPITDITQINAPNKTYVLTCSPAPCNITINNNGTFNQAPLVLFVNGNVTIDINTFNPGSNKSVAIIATDTITFSGTTGEANGIFIANNIDTGATTNKELKIKGNLIATTSFTNNRKRSDNRKPALFVAFDMQKYMDLLPYLSIAKYEWTQLK